MRRALLVMTALTLSGCFDWDTAAKDCTEENGCLKLGAGGGTTPSPPTDVSATAAIRIAHVTWNEPASTGGSSLIRYNVTAEPGGQTASVAAPALALDVEGLSNDTSYTFTVVATNFAGDSAPSQASSAVTTFGLPTAPTEVTATGGFSSANLTWTAPATNGGSPVTDYTVTSSPGGLTATTTGATQATVPGLSNSISYTFTVKATTAVGDSPLSAPSNAVTPAPTASGPPTAVIATAGNGEATVQWIAPTDNGGSPITGYTVTSSPGGLTANTTGATQATVLGLTNGTPYTFTVKATNAIGDSLPSAASNAATPVTVPGVPTAVSATRGNGQATVQWAPPLNSGGSAITGYFVTSTPTGGSATASGTQATITGLANGTPYTFSVQAINAVGNSLSSAPSNAVTPATVPGAPTAVSANGGNGQATVQWAAPVDNGGSPVTGYTVSASDGGFSASTDGGTSATVVGLTNGSPYTFTVNATNDVGVSLPSAASNAVTPATVPGAPTAVSAVGGNAQATVQWTAPLDNGGSAITSYRVTSSPGGLTASTSGATLALVTGLTNGTPYTFTVTATNAAGNSALSAPSSVVTPTTVPGAPRTVAALSADQRATVSWSVPTSNGGSPILGYTVTATPGGLTATTTGATQVAMTGLLNGTSYTFSATATNAVGIGPPSAPSNPATPALPCTGTLVLGGPPLFEAGTTPTSVVRADFNGDSRLDLAVANQGTANVSVLLGRGDGTFLAAVNYSIGTNPTSVTVGDFNGDSRPDLAVANFLSSNVSVLLGNGNGTFLAAVNYSTGSSPKFVNVGDFNGDARPDLVIVSSSVGILLGNGNGTFQAVVAYAAGSSPESVAVGDFNGDSRLDLAVANSGSANVTVLLGNGNGTFLAGVNHAAGTNPQSVAVGDFNGDSRLDLAVANQGSASVSVLLGNGNGTFLGAVGYSAGTNPYSVAVGDYNGDSRLDLAVANRASNNVSVLLGNGNGTFLAAVNYTAGNFPRSVTVGDFNGDAKLDLAVANDGGGNVSVLLGNGNGTFLAAVNSSVGSNPTSVAVGDFNGDSRLDLAVTNQGSASVSVLLGNGNGTFLAAVNYAVGSNPFSVTVGDFNGDSRLDLAVASASSSISVLLGNANGTFLAAVNYPVSSGPYSVAVGDFNGDSRLDLAVTGYSSASVSVLLGNGDGTFLAAVSYSAGTFARSVTVGDFNGDSRLDLAVANSGGTNVSILLGNGNGTFLAAVNYTVGAFPYFIAVGDFNGDSRLDLAVANSNSGNVSVLLGNGNGTFLAAVNYSVGLLSPESVSVGDFNGDSKLDLVVGGSRNHVGVLLGTGGGAFLPVVNYSASAGPRSVTVGDFNGDARLDLASANSGSANVSVLLNLVCLP